MANPINDEAAILEALGELSPAQVLEVKVAVRAANVVNDLIDEEFDGTDALVCCLVWAATVLAKKQGVEAALVALQATSGKIAESAITHHATSGAKH